MNSTILQPILIVIGASDPTGSELARLGVAYGADVVGVTGDGAAPCDEPWTHGVRWGDDQTVGTASIPDQPQERAVVIVRSDSPARWVQWARAIGASRVAAIVGEGETLSGAVTVAPRRVFTGAVPEDQPTADASSIHVERLAMALLRVALDEEPPDHLDHDDLCELGDAVFWASG